MHCINNMNGIASGLIIASCVFYSCTSRTGEISPVHEQTNRLAVTGYNSSTRG